MVEALLRQSDILPTPVAIRAAIATCAVVWRFTEGAVAISCGAAARNDRLGSITSTHAAWRYFSFATGSWLAEPKRQQLPQLRSISCIAAKRRRGP